MCNNKYLVEYFLGCFGYNLDFDAPLVYAALQRTDRELKRRLSEADIPDTELNDLWDALNSFEFELKEYKSDFPTLYSVFEANNFTYI